MRRTGDGINDDNERGRDDDEPFVGRRSRFVASAPADRWARSMSGSGDPDFESSVISETIESRLTNSRTKEHLLLTK
jgi:hypothetical protein